MNNTINIMSDALKTLSLSELNTAIEHAKKNKNKGIDDYRNPQSARNEESILSEINRDIENLKKIFEQASLPIMDVDKTFYYIFFEKINLTKQAFIEEDSKQAKEFGKFWNRYCKEIYKKEYDSIIGNIEKLQKRQEILQEMKNLIVELEK